MTSRASATALRDKILREGWGLLPLRLLVGFGFAAHGYAKLARGPEHFAAIVAALGLPAPVPVAWATTLVELGGGVALIAGALVVPVSVPLVIVMLTAMIGVHGRYGFSSIRLTGLTSAGAAFGPVGYEVALLYVAALAALALGGAGPLSVDRWLAARRSQRAGARAAPPASSE